MCTGLSTEHFEMEENISLPLNACDFKTSQNRDNIVGKGASAVVRLCHHSNLGNVVVKCFGFTGSVPGEPVAASRIKDSCHRELTVLSHLKHKNIVKIYGLIEWQYSMGLVLEFVNGSTLQNFIGGSEFTPWLLRLRLAKEIFEGLTYLHYYDDKKHVFIHGDLKPQNILLTSDLSVKLADFGSVSVILATGASEGTIHVAKTNQHTAFYAAPEFLKDVTIPRTKAMDMYSAALIIYEIITEITVFSNVRANPGLIIRLIIDSKLKPDMKCVDEVLKTLESRNLKMCKCLNLTMQKCSKGNPDGRPKVKEAASTLIEAFNRFDSQDDQRLIAIAMQSWCNHLKHTKEETPKISLDKFRHPFENCNTGDRVAEGSREPDVQSQMNRTSSSETQALPSAALLEGEQVGVQPLPDYDVSEFLTMRKNPEHIVQLGNGTFLQKYQHPDLGEVSIKYYSMFGSIQKKKKEIQQEVAVMRRLKHKNIVEILGTNQWSNYFGIVMEYLSGGNLEDFLMSSDHHDIPWLLRRRLFSDIADGVLHLHQHDKRKVFVHGDLKPQNILLTKDLRVKIAGFGLTKIVAKSGVGTASTSISRQSNIEGCVAWYYTAPEVLNDPLIQGKPSADLYSVAMLGYEILTRHQVFEDASPDLVVDAIRREGMKPNDKPLRYVELLLKGKPRDLSIFKLLESIIKKCWDFQPEVRLNIRDVREKLDEHFQVADDKILNAELEPLKQSIASRRDSRESSTQTVNLREVYAQAQASTNQPFFFPGH